MPPRPRKPNEFAQQTMPLVLLCMAIIATNSYFTFVDDEARSLDAAAQPARTLLVQSFSGAMSGSDSGAGQHAIPPLYGILLHFWLRATAWNFDYLRIPAISFFLVGLFLLGRAARRFGSPESAKTTIWLSILWPFGFLYGRLEAPYSFIFLLIAGLTLAYLKLLEKNSFGNEVTFFLFGAALVWTDFFGWAVLACLVIDQLLRHYHAKGAEERMIPVGVMVRSFVLWIVVSAPVLRSLYGEFTAGENIHQSFRTIIVSLAIYVYTLFVSESVAPWHWQLSVPAALAVIVCIVLVFVKKPGPSRRFLFYSALLLMLMAATGTLLSSRLFFIAPWVLLPIAVAIGSIESRWVRPALALTLLIIGAIGWSGIYAQRYYSAPQFLENWSKEAGDTADKIRAGAAVVSNSRPFFLYLTYALRASAFLPDLKNQPKLNGLLPDSFRQPNVATPDQWLSSGHPMAPSMIWIHGVSDPQSEAPMENAAHVLDTNCGSRQSRLMMRDAGYDWKSRFLPAQVGPQWRMEIREYDCASSSSKEIFPIPAH